MKLSHLPQSLLLRVVAAACAVSTASCALAQTITVLPDNHYQTIRGFGGHNGPGWIPDLTPVQIDTAFGTGAGQIGLSIMRMRIDASSANWSIQVPAAQLAKAKGATLFATPWSPPGYMKTSNSIVHGSLLPAYHGDYATHLLNFASFMQANNAGLHAISVQNEPDLDPSYEGCLWTPAEFISFLASQGPRFGALKVIAPETQNFKKTFSDPILNDANAVPQFDIVGGHLYGTTPSDYPLALSKGKELWMTEHYIDSAADANDWPKALPVAVEIHRSMVANYSAYVWWYIRRSYGLLTENGQVSKRGHIMAQYAKHVRPGDTRVGATEKPYADVFVSAFKDANGKIVVVAVNTGATQRHVDFNFGTGTASSLLKYTTSAVANGEYGGEYAVNNGVASAELEPSSVTTFIKQPAAVDLTASVMIGRSGLTTDRHTGQFHAVISVTNNTTTLLAGTLQLALEGLGPNVGVDNRSGERKGMPYIAVPATAIAPGATVNVPVTFSNPSKVGITYVPRLHRITY